MQTFRATDLAPSCSKDWGSNWHNKVDSVLILVTESAHVALGDLVLAILTPRNQIPGSNTWLRSLERMRGGILEEWQEVVESGWALGTLVD